MTGAEIQKMMEHMKKNTDEAAKTWKGKLKRQIEEITISRLFRERTLTSSNARCEIKSVAVSYSVRSHPNSNASRICVRTCLASRQCAFRQQ